MDATYQGIKFTDEDVVNFDNWIPNHPSLLTATCQVGLDSTAVLRSTSTDPQAPAITNMDDSGGYDEWTEHTVNCYRFTNLRINRILNP